MYHSDKHPHRVSVKKYKIYKTYCVPNIVPYSNFIKIVLNIKIVDKNPDQNGSILYIFNVFDC